MSALGSARAAVERSGLADAIRQELLAGVRGSDADGIGCLLLDEDGMLRLAAASDAAARALELAEELCVEGPCHAAFVDDEVTVSDLRLDDRWGRLWTLLAARPIRTIIGVPVSHEGIRVGAIDAFSASPRNWGEENVVELRRTAGRIGALVGAALQVRLDDRGDALTAGLRVGLGHRALLARASEVIAETSGISLPRAGLQLRQREDVAGSSLVGVANEIVEQGSPSPPDRPGRSGEEASRHVRERVSSRALTDPLTGLANRALLLEHLASALEASESSGTRPAVVLCGLDRFTTVNDSLGRDVGDEVLQAVAIRLLESVGGSDVVARVGSDEFAVQLRQVASASEAMELARRLRSALNEPLTIHGLASGGDAPGARTLSIQASLGVAFATEPSQMTAARLLHDADTAMQESKRRSSGPVTSSTSQLRDTRRRRSRVEVSLRAMLDAHRAGDPLSDGLRLVYQPIVSLEDACLDSVEALVRWNHPEVGEVPASEVIDVAEAGGMMGQLGALLLTEACATAATWRRDHGAADLVVAVNVSALQLDDPGFVTVVSEALASTGLPADRLRLELTESHLFARAGAAMQALTVLSGRGVGITLDDFGTGYSSLSHLARLPVDQVKIDREFVAMLGADGHATAVARTVVALARSLDLRTVAEGIETDEQAESVIDLAFDLGQGYLYQRPVAPDRIIDLLVADGPVAPGNAQRRPPEDGLTGHGASPDGTPGRGR